jgi:polyisoprenoid-binding protein YceI
LPTHPVEGTSPVTAGRRRRWKGLVAATFLALGPASASADELVLTLQPEKTSVTFRVRAPILDIDGVLALDSGQIRFDPDTGMAAGQITIDLRQARTGNWLRDREMRTLVLETERWPLAVFRPDRVLGALARSGVSDLVIAGIVVVHGTEHAFVLPVKVDLSGDAMSAEAVFEIPYVAWGLRNPSIFFLRVAPVAAVTVKAEGNLRPDSLARHAVSAP